MFIVYLNNKLYTLPSIRRLDYYPFPLIARRKLPLKKLSLSRYLNGRRMKVIILLLFFCRNIRKKKSELFTIANWYCLIAGFRYSINVYCVGIYRYCITWNSFWKNSERRRLTSVVFLLQTFYSRASEPYTRTRSRTMYCTYCIIPTYINNYLFRGEKYLT